VNKDINNEFLSHSNGISKLFLRLRLKDSSVSTRLELLHLKDGLYMEHRNFLYLYYKQNYERLLLISGLDYNVLKGRSLIVKLYNMHDFDRYIEILSMVHYMTLENITYNRELVVRFFK
jgi:hypothetical protein